VSPAVHLPARSGSHQMIARHQSHETSTRCCDHQETFVHAMITIHTYRYRRVGISESTTAFPHHTRRCRSHLYYFLTRLTVTLLHDKVRACNMHSIHGSPGSQHTKEKKKKQPPHTTHRMLPKGFHQKNTNPSVYMKVATSGGAFRKVEKYSYVEREEKEKEKKKMPCIDCPP
jgi:hypothetical protein